MRENSFKTTLVQIFTSNTQLFKNNREEINNYNNKLLSIISGMGILISVMLFLTIPLTHYETILTFKIFFNFSFYTVWIFLFFLMFIIHVLSLKLCPKIPWLTSFIYYLFFLEVFVFGYFNRFVLQPYGEVFTFQTLFLLMPILFITRGKILCLVESLFFILFLITCLNCTNGIPQSVLIKDILNSFFSCIFGLSIGSVVRKSRLLAFDKSRQLIIQRDTDFLTNLPNRRKLFIELNKSFSGNAKPVRCIFMADIDYFKNYNDTYGHQAGDEILHLIGKTFMEFSARTGFEIFRYGGEEFIGFFRQDCDINYREEIENLRSIFYSLQIESAVKEIKNVSLSIGFANSNKCQTSDYEELISYADKALYVAKDAGRNCVMEYAPSSMGKNEQTCSPYRRKKSKATL